MSLKKKKKKETKKKKKNPKKWRDELLVPGILRMLYI